MLKLISTPAQAFDNIKKFEEGVHSSPELQARLPYARAWYAYREGAGAWHFGPSKFVGYEGLDAKTYLQTAQETDGRRTEAQLKTMFETVGPMHPAYNELTAALLGFLAQYGKAPSTKTRINISRGLRRLFSPERSPDDAYGALVKVIVEAAKALPTKHFQELREQLEDVWS